MNSKGFGRKAVVFFCNVLYAYTNGKTYEMHTKPWVGNLKKKDDFHVLGVDDRIREYIKMDVSKVGGEDMD
jgi:hypothetical protein